MTNPMDLTGKRVVVTGASSGIGRACAILASQLGATVVLIARDEKRLDQTMSQMSGVGHSAVPYDLSDLEHYEELFKRCASDQKLNGIVHAAGICPVMPLQSLTPAAMRKVMTLNYFSFLELARYFSKKKVSDGGSMVAISSVSAQAGWLGGTLYCGSKGALDASIRALALELAAKKIRVNSVVPSNIRTPMLEEMISVAGAEAEKEIHVRQPLGIGDPSDVAHAVVFLLSDAAKFISGTNLVVDGGYLAQ